MFLTILSYEFKLLIRSKWLLVLFFIIMLLIVFASHNGNKNVEKRVSDISVVQRDFSEKDSVMLATLIKIEKGEKVDGPYWKLPSAPMTIGNRYPRLAIMQPESLSFIATGQSDMYTHFKSPKVYGNNFALDYAEMINPVQLLFGNFDIAFVLIYILPLLIIAFTYNILSREKELGTLRIIAAQPISTFSWLFQKLVIRFLFFSAITTFILCVTIVIFSTEASVNVFDLLGLFLLAISYYLFWFVMTFIVNIKINDSSKNALTLVGLWLLIVLVIPATINQIGNALYPIPSRLNMINEIRAIKKESEAKQDEIMDTYLRNHPELAQGNDKKQFGFWHNYFASEKVMEEKTEPLLKKYDLQLKKQQKFIMAFQFASPAIIVQQSLNKIAATSEMHYNDFKKQVFEFSKQWRNYLKPILFRQEKFTVKNYYELPKFYYQNRIKHRIWLNVFILFSINGIILLIFGGKKLVNKLPHRFLKLFS